MKAVALLVLAFGLGGEGERYLISGSSTVTPILTEITTRLQETDPDLKIDIQTGGSTRGILDTREGRNLAGMASMDQYCEPIVRDRMYGKPFDSHTHRPVPFLVRPSPGQTFQWKAREGTLANVAATCLLSLGIEPPDWMEPPLVRFE